MVSIERPWLLALLCASSAVVLWLTARKQKATRKTRISTVLHGFSSLLCALAVCSLSVYGASRDRAAFLLLDYSASASAAQEEIRRVAALAMEHAPDGQKTGVILFGQNAAVEMPLQEKAARISADSSINPAGSDAGAAVSLAGALLPSESAGAIALITDGLIDAADVSALAARGIPVNVYLVGAGEQADAQVSGVELPSLSYQGQAFSVTVTVDSTVEGEGTLLLFKNRQLSLSKKVTLRKGQNTFSFSDRADSSGVVAYEAQIVMPGDQVAPNNRKGTYMSVQGAPRVLIVEGRSGDGRELAKMLTASGMDCETVSSGALPDTASSLLEYHAISLCNVSADELSDGQISAVREAVRTFGRGLAVFGGDQSYALGGYRGSELEAMLPVTSDVKSTMDIPSLALILALDKSGSMTEGRYGITRLEVAKEAAARSADILLPTDQIGVIAFDDAAQWVVPLQKAENLEEIQRRIGTIRPGGGTAFYSPLLAAYRSLAQADAARKHIIFLTDGEPGDQGFETLIREMEEEKITLTTVAVGTGANGRLLESMAEAGGGRAWAADEFDNVPAIFTKETMMLTGAYVQNRVFTPVITEEGPLTAYSGFPQLSGYMGTSPKPQAAVSLESDREDPVLAWWQYGAGRVICWTSDTNGGWTAQFLGWQEAPAFFGGILSKVLPENQQGGWISADGQMIRYTTDAPVENGSAAVSIVLPGGEVVTEKLVQVSPDSFEGKLPDAGPGAYAISVECRSGNELISSLEGGTVVPYAREYDLRRSAEGTVERLAAQTGGKVLEDPKLLLQFQADHAAVRKDLRTLLMIAALFFFVLDIAQRRLPWEKWIKLQENSGGREKIKKETPGLKSKNRTAKREQEKPETTEELWQAMQKKKRM